MEDLILENAVSLTMSIEKKIQKENIIDYFCQVSNVAVLNNLWCFIAGSKYVKYKNKYCYKLNSNNIFLSLKIKRRRPKSERSFGHFKWKYKKKFSERSHFGPFAIFEIYYSRIYRFYGT